MRGGLGCAHHHQVTPFHSSAIFSCASDIGYTKNFYEVKRRTVTASVCLLMFYGPNRNVCLPLLQAKYACSTCRPERGCASDLGCRSAADLAALNGTTVALVGDSLKTELAVAMHCVIDRSALAVVWPAPSASVVPFRHPLTALLREVLASADVVIFNFGIWYNWDPTVDTQRPRYSRLSEEHTTKQIEECITQGIRAPKLAGNCTRRHCLTSPTSALERIQGAFWRRNCAGSLGKLAYASDLKRFAVVLRKVAAERRWRARKLIWRASTPQHYSGPSGMFPLKRSNTWPGAGACIPVRNDSLAADRNAVADSMLHSLLRPGGPPYMTRWSTWDHDLGYHDEHPRGADCSHFCLHSTATWNWVRLLLACLVGRDCGR